MLDITLIVDNKDVLKMAAQKRRVQVDIDRLVILDGDRRAAALRKDDAALAEIMKEWRALMLAVPNIPDMSVPEGESAEGNKEVRRWSPHDPETGQPEESEGVRKSGEDVMKEFGMLVPAGPQGGMMLRGDGVRLADALITYARDFFEKRECEIVRVPTTATRGALMGTGYLVERSDELVTADTGEFLATAAIPAMMGRFANEMLAVESLPRKTSTTAECFSKRTDADTARLHSETVCEQLVITEASHQESVRWHEWLLLGIEAFLQSLHLSYRVMVECSGMMERGAVKTYTVEVWHPSAGAYVPLGSVSYYHDFYTRRMNIRYRDDKQTVRFAHSLSARAFTLVPLMHAVAEEWRRLDGTPTVPEPLLTYLPQYRYAKE